MGNNNSNLQTAKNIKDDEFYTTYEAIEKELQHYLKHFRGKVVLCNCDDPFKSNFCRYFVRNFNKLGLKRLICTSYVASEGSLTQTSLFDCNQIFTAETHHQKFLENGTAERAKESGTEQNYNMIDGCVNNNPKKPRIIGNRISVLDRLHIKLEERKQKSQPQQLQQQERSRKS